MSITVEEADKLICPRTIGIAPIYVDGAGVRDGGPWSCVGPRCMAWRWQTTYEPPTSFGVSSQQAPMGKTTISTTHGYCGLAGRSET